MGKYEKNRLKQKKKYPKETHTHTQNLTKKMKGIKKNVIKKCCKKKKQKGY
jgi:hypothetical protein